MDDADRMLKNAIYQIKRYLESDRASTQTLRNADACLTFAMDVIALESSTKNTTAPPKAGE